MLHASAMGKAFVLMPSGKTFLETKLSTFRFGATAFAISLLLRSVLEQMHPGVLVCSADTLEYVGQAKFDQSADVILFGHESPLSVAEQHGVYALRDDGQLEFVLQKPSTEEMRSKGVLRGETAITDSCYILSADTVRELVVLRQTRGGTITLVRQLG